MKTGLLVTLFSAAVGALLSPEQQSQQQQQQRMLPIVPAAPVPLPQEEEPLRAGARMKRFDPNTKVSDIADAADVVVERWEPETDPLDPTPGTSDVAWRTIYSPVVMIVEITGVESYLSESGTWIDSTFTGTVRQLLKNATTTSYGVNAQMSFVMSGGSLAIGKSRVEALTRSAKYRTRPIRRGGQYLVFTIQRPGGVLYAHPTFVYELQGTLLRPLRDTDEGISKTIAARGADNVIAEVLSSKDLPKPSKRGGGGR